MATSENAKRNDADRRDTGHGESDAASEVEQLKAEFASLRADMQEIAGTVRRMSDEKVAEGRARARATADRSREYARDGLSTLGSEIENRPATSVAAAFGIGLLLGRLLRR